MRDFKWLHTTLYSCIDMCRQMNLQLLCIPPVAAESAWALVARRSTSPVSQITRGCSGSWCFWLDDLVMSGVSSFIPKIKALFKNWPRNYLEWRYSSSQPRQHVAEIGEFRNHSVELSIALPRSACWLAWLAGMSLGWLFGAWPLIPAPQLNFSQRQVARKLLWE